MEIRIVLFLAFVSIALITNTLLIFMVYKALSGVTSKVTEGVSAISGSEIAASLSALQSASEQAVAMTEATKAKLAECQPVVENAQKNYHATLDKVDSALQDAAEQITTNATKVRDMVAKPAFSFMSFAAGLVQMIENLEQEE